MAEWYFETFLPAFLVFYVIGSRERAGYGDRKLS